MAAGGKASPARQVARRTTTTTTPLGLSAPVGEPRGKGGMTQKQRPKANPKERTRQNWVLKKNGSQAG